MTDLINPLNLLILLIGGAVALILGLRLAKDPSFGLVLMAFFLPFERIPSLDIAGFTFKVNHFIAGLTFVFWLLAVLFSRRKIAPNPLAFPLTLMFFFFFLSGLNAGDSFRQLTVFISLLIMLMIYVTTLNALTSKAILQSVVGFLFLGVGLMSLLALFQFFGDMAGLPTSITGLDPGYTKVVFGFPRVHAFSKEPLYFANYLFIPLGVALALFLSKQKSAKPLEHESLAHQIISRLRGPWLLPLIILMMVVFFLTLSRGAYLALVPFSVVLAAFYSRQVFNLKNITLTIVATVISLSAVYAILDSVSYDAVDRFIGHATLDDVLVTKSGESGFGRLAAFEIALKAWRSSPIVGIGLGNYGPYVESYPLAKPTDGWDIVNNEYLELLAETGILGVLAVLSLLVVVFSRSVKAYKAAKDEYLKAVLVGLTAALVGIFVQYNFFSTFYIIHIWVLFGLVVGTQNIILVSKRLPEDR